MTDKKLLLAAMMDDEFQLILQNDLQLNMLEANRYNKARLLQQFNALFNRKLKIDSIEVNQITLSRWSLLWILNNAFVTSADNITTQDIDLFVYILDCDVHLLNEYAIVNSIDYCKKLDINYDNAAIDIVNAITNSFSSMKMLSDTASSNDEEVFFGADWVTHIASIVSQLCNESLDYIINLMSLCTCYLLLIQAIRKNSTKKIFRLTDDDINKQMFLRTYQLANIYYKKKYGGTE